MNKSNLTVLQALAKRHFMKCEGRKMAERIGLALCAPLGLAGCIQVNAPEEPIVIQLDINIRAEIVRLTEDANNTIEDNDGIF